MKLLFHYLQIKKNEHKWAILEKFLKELPFEY